MIQLSNFKPTSPSRREVLVVGPDRRRVARLARSLEPFGFGLEQVVYRPGPFGVCLPDVAPGVIVADATAPVTANHYALFLMLYQRWQRIPCIAVTATLDHRILSAFRTLGVDEFASDVNGATGIATRLWRHLAEGSAAAQCGTGAPHGIDCDATRHTVTANGRRVSLTTREFQLFACLAERRNAPVPPREIARCVWGDETTSRSSAGAVCVYVFHLRRKLAMLGLEQALRTVRGKGYMLIDAANGAAMFPEQLHGIPD
jgi:DNA-binding response OmpR family regulator